MQIIKRFRFLLLIFLITQLTACATASHHHRSHYDVDGPPDFDIDVSKIPDAVPKVEPLSKYGNPVSYVAEGQRYYTMKSAEGYDEKGIASWYGMKFNKIRTSSGEPYLVTGMTAAHRTLPIPTYVQVTNLQNGKHVVVKVNDRGPFVNNRLIDLSYVAAKKLGVTAHGTALVEVSAIDPRHWTGSKDNHLVSNIAEVPAISNKAATPPPAEGTPHIFLQIGAFSIQENANRLAVKVRQLTELPVLVKTGLLHDRPVFRVQIGPVPDVDSTDNLTDKLVSEGIDKPVVVID